MTAPEERKRMGPAGWLLGLSIGGALGWAVVTFAFQSQVAPQRVVRVTASGPVREVQGLAEGYGAVAAPVASGTWEVPIPVGLGTPRVMVVGPGGARVRGAGLHLIEGEEPLALEPLGLWTTGLRIQRDGRDVRFEWEPAPEGVGLPPERRRYSLLIEFPKRGEREGGESALLSKDAGALQLPFQELLDQLPDLAAADAEVRLELRVYDPSRTNDTVWVGAAGKWKLGTTEWRQEE